MKLRTAVVCVVLTFSGGALAHEGHEPERAKVVEVSEETAKARAAEEVKRLVSVKKVDAAWSDAKLKTVEKKTAEGRWEWLATFEAPKAKEKALFVFLKPSGEFVEANFTGK